MITKQKSIQLLLLLSGLLVIAASPFLINRVQRIISLANPDQVVLFFAPSTISVDNNSEFNLDLAIDTQNNNVSGIDLAIAYDPQFLELTNINPTGVLPIILKGLKVSSGSANIVLGSKCSVVSNEIQCSAFNGVGSVARLSFRALNAGSSNIRISTSSGSQTVVTTVNNNSPASFTSNTAVVNISSSQTPTPQPTVTPVPTPLPTKTPSPTRTPSPTPAPTQSPSPNGLSILPSDDTYVNSSYPSNNYGSQSNFYSDGNPKVDALLKFDLTSYSSSNIESAFLSITPSQSRTVDKLVKTANSNWSEESVTWNTKPGYLDTIATINQSVSTGQSIDINVTNAVKAYAGQQMSLVIEDTTGGYTLNVYSKENGSNQPVLKITQSSSQPSPSTGRISIYEDSYVNERNQSRNYGSRNSLISDGNPKVISYIKFDLRGVSASSFSTAKLHIVPELSRKLYKEFKATSNNWNEESLTWNNRPTTQSAIAVLDQKVETNVPIEIDITSFIKQNAGGFASIAIEDPSGGYTLEFDSKEVQNSSTYLILQ